MTTIDGHGNHHTAGGVPGAGRFTGKGTPKPVGALTDDDAPAVPSDEQFAALGREVAALLGTTAEWNRDLISRVGEMADNTLGVPVGSQNPAALALWRKVADGASVEYDTDDDDDDYQECERCGDDVHTLSTDGLCDGCVEEAATTTDCPNCGERVPNDEMNYTGTTNEMCDSCVHNAVRSGWTAPAR